MENKEASRKAPRGFERDETSESALGTSGASGASGVEVEHTSSGDILLMKPYDSANVDARVRVNKAYKMFIGGAFVRSESGRYFQVEGAPSEEDLGADPATVNVPRGSRKDVRDAVLAARSALVSWERRTAYNRGQILYRLAEVMESRRPELTQSLVRGGETPAEAASQVNVSIDRVVFYAGFADKFFALLASSNPVAGPHFNFSVPEPMGTIGVIAPDRPALLGLVSTILPIITGGNTCVALAGERDPRTSIVWSECLATSDIPGGVVNILTGHANELAVHFAKHREVAGIDAWMVDPNLRRAVESEGADSVKRVTTRVPMDAEAWSNERKAQGLGWIERFLETKTIWHPVGV